MKTHFENMENHEKPAQTIKNIEKQQKMSQRGHGKPAPNFTQRIIDSEKKTLAFLAGFVRPFSGIKWHPQGRANPRQV